ncbi:MAG: hypothetical protein GAK45_01454 [Pseudomonas citronellolis]|nr:MAG: hypothetical protein GAK45_01454 [Pseudomonas citronellolis]
MISAPREIRCMVMSLYSMNTKTIASTSGIEQATTSPARTPRLTKLTARTMTMASNSALVKPPTAFSTTSAWFDTVCTPTPTGSSLVICCMRWRRASPNCWILPPLRIATARPMAGLPS